MDGQRSACHTGLNSEGFNGLTIGCDRPEVAEFAEALLPGESYGRVCRIPLVLDKQLMTLTDIYSVLSTIKDWATADLFEEKS